MHDRNYVYTPRVNYEHFFLSRLPAVSLFVIFSYYQSSDWLLSDCPHIHQTPKSRPLVCLCNEGLLRDAAILSWLLMILLTRQRESNSGSLYYDLKIGDLLQSLASNSSMDVEYRFIVSQAVGSTSLWVVYNPCPS
jgi:hypothetical protein